VAANDPTESDAFEVDSVLNERLARVAYACSRSFQPLSKGAQSGSNLPLSYRSALRGRERQLSFLANAYSVPFAVVADFEKRSFSDYTHRRLQSHE
jgi:hypothetical protein